VEKATLLRRDRLIIEAQSTLRQLRPNSQPTAKEIDAEVRRVDPHLHGKWVGGQDLRGRKATVLRVLREERSPEVSNSRRAGTKRAARPSALPSPLWLVGKQQRDDLRASYIPVPKDYTGAYELQILNRGRAPATDVEVRISSTFRTVIPLIEPGERGRFSFEEHSSVHIYADLLGGNMEMSSARYSEGPGKEFRPLVSIRFTYNGIPNRSLKGELWGSSKRYFYRFKPVRGRATPIY
jgi:hypothetical protein